MKLGLVVLKHAVINTIGFSPQELKVFSVLGLCFLCVYVCVISPRVDWSHIILNTLIVEGVSVFFSFLKHRGLQGALACCYRNTNCICMFHVTHKDVQVLRVPRRSQCQ